MRKIEELNPKTFETMFNMGLYQYMMRSTNIKHDIKVRRHYMRRGKELVQEFWAEQIGSESGKEYLMLPSSIVLRYSNDERLQTGRYYIGDREITLKNPVFTLHDYSVSIFEVVSDGSNN